VCHFYLSCISFTQNHNTSDVSSFLVFLDLDVVKKEVKILYKLYTASKQVWCKDPFCRRFYHPSTSKLKCTRNPQLTIRWNLIIFLKITKKFSHQVFMEGINFNVNALYFFDLIKLLRLKYKYFDLI